MQNGNYVTAGVNDMPSSNCLKIGWWSLPFCCVAKKETREATFRALHFAILFRVNALLHSNYEVQAHKYMNGNMDKFRLY